MNLKTTAQNLWAKTWVKLVSFFLLGILATNFSHSADDWPEYLGMGGTTEKADNISYTEEFWDEEAPRTVKMVAPSPSSRFMAAEIASVDKGNASDNTATDHKIIRTGSVEIEVQKTEDTVEQVKNYLDEIQGFIDNLNIYEWRHQQMKADITLRIPSDLFDEAIGKFKSLGRVHRESSNSQDITQNYRDNKARIANLKAREEQLREFFRKAYKVEETLDIYRELEDVRYEIEKLERQQLHYDKQVTFSTIHLEITPEIIIEEIENDQWSIQKVWRAAINNLKETLRNLAEIGVGFAVYGVIWGPVILLILIIWGIWKWRHQK